MKSQQQDSVTEAILTCQTILQADFPHRGLLVLNLESQVTHRDGLSKRQGQVEEMAQLEKSQHSCVKCGGPYSQSQHWDGRNRSIPGICWLVSLV